MIPICSSCNYTVVVQSRYKKNVVVLYIMRCNLLLPHFSLHRLSSSPTPIIYYSLCEVVSL
uniref:Uncharacterized protein n=1 Tax=Lepeophtheirus salmonis TaxID=72036 RepID=A0A0K2TVD8_LEPSM